MSKTNGTPPHRGARLSDQRALPTGYQLGAYRIENLLGRGGFAFTYFATHQSRNGNVSQWAIKELFPEGMVRDSRTGAINVASDSESNLFNFAFKSFEREARLLIACQHPNIVRVLDCFEYNGTAYLVMPYVDGEQLFNYCSSQGTEDGRNYQMPEEEIFSYLEPLLDGLDYVHRQGIFHRDLKPENIFLTSERQPLLLDFGAAKESNHWNRKSHNAGTVAIESVGYSPYEQLYLGGDIGPWTDIYALGAVLHFLINPKMDRSNKGAVPPPANSRGLARHKGEPDPYVKLAHQSALANRYSMGLLAGIDWALEFEHEDRPKSIGDWKSCLFAPQGESAEREPLPTEHKVNYTRATSSYERQTDYTGRRTNTGPSSADHSQARQADLTNIQFTHSAGGGTAGSLTQEQTWAQSPKPPLPFWKIFLLVLAGFTIFVMVCFGLAYGLKNLWN